MKKRPPDFPYDLEIPAGISWSPKNKWMVRRRIKGILSSSVNFKNFKDALAYRNELFSDKLEASKPLEEAHQQYIEVRNRLSIENRHLLTLEQLENKIDLYRSRLNLLWKEHAKKRNQNVI